MNFKIAGTAYDNVTAVLPAFIAGNDSMVYVKISSKEKQIRTGETTRPGYLMAFYRAANGEVLNKNIYLSEKPELGDAGEVVKFSVNAKALHAVISSFSMVEGGVECSYDPQASMLWFTSKEGNIRLKLNTSEAGEFANSSADNTLCAMVDCKEFKNAINLVKGLSAGICYDLKNGDHGMLTIYGINADKSLSLRTDIKAKSGKVNGVYKDASGNEATMGDIAVPMAVLSKAALFSDSAVKVFIGSDRLIMVDTTTLIESPLARPQINMKVMGALQERFKNNLCVARVDRAHMNVALNAMKVAAQAKALTEAKKDNPRTKLTLIKGESNEIALSMDEGEQAMTFKPETLGFTAGSTADAWFVPDRLADAIAKTGNSEQIMLLCNKPAAGEPKSFAFMNYTDDKAKTASTIVFVASATAPEAKEESENTGGEEEEEK